MTKHVGTLFILFVLFTAGRSVAQSEKIERKENKIDDEYASCLTKDSSSVNICNCGFVAYDKWNKELDDAYKKLLKTLKTDKDKAALRQAQSAWLAYKTAEFKAYDIMFNLPGNTWKTLRQDGRIDLVRDRATQLRSYLDSFKK